MTWNLICRLAVAAALGTVIGLDREYRAKDAGFRTHFLVSLGSALFMVISQYGFDDWESPDPSRVAAQVVSGIGFIGAGTIIFRRHIVRGLTTAASLWAVAGIGMAAGAGMYGIAVAAALLTLAGLEALSFVFRGLGARRVYVSFYVPERDAAQQMFDALQADNYALVSYEVTQLGIEGRTAYRVAVVLKLRGGNDEGSFIRVLQSNPDVLVERVE